MSSASIRPRARWSQGPTSAMAPTASMTGPVTATKPRSSTSPVSNEGTTVAFKNRWSTSNRCAVDSTMDSLRPKLVWQARDSLVAVVGDHQGVFYANRVNTGYHHMRLDREAPSALEDDL